MNRRSTTGSAARGAGDLQPRPRTPGRDAPGTVPWLLIPRRRPGSFPARAGNRAGTDV